MTTTPNEGFLLDLLDRVVATAGADGAHRLFLRLPADSSTLRPALQHGFSVVMEETLFEGAVVGDGRVDGRVDGSGTTARRRRRSDDHALFQLHSQAVNQEVRWLMALSPREWRAALDPLGRGGQEWVLPGDDNVSISALIRIAPGRKMACATVLSDNLDHADTAVSLALRRGGKKRGRVRLLSGAGDVNIAAERAGLAAVGSFQLLVRPIAQRANRLQLAEQAVEGRRAARHPVTDWHDPTRDTCDTMTERQSFDEPLDPDTIFGEGEPSTDAVGDTPAIEADPFQGVTDDLEALLGTLPAELRVAIEAASRDRDAGQRLAAAGDRARSGPRAHGALRRR